MVLDPALLLSLLLVLLPLAALSPLPDEEALDVSPVAGVVAGVPTLLPLLSLFLLEPPLYASAYQPEPLRMKLAELMSRRTASTPHEGHTFVGSSLMR